MVRDKIRKKINILIMGVSGNLGGIEIFVKDLILNSDPRKFQFTLVVDYGITVPYQEEILAYGAKIVRVHTKKGGYLKYLRRLKEIYSNNHFDIIHINLMTYSQFEPIKYACKYSNAKVIVHSHNIGFKKGRYKTRVLHQIGKIMIRKCNFERVACGEEAGRYLFGNRSFRVFYNGIDFDKFSFSSFNRSVIRQELKIDDSDYIIGNVAIFTELKNQGFLIKIFSLLKEKVPNSKLLLVGVGPKLNKCIRQAKKMGIEENVVFLGKRTDVDKIYSALDVYAMPSTSEGLSISMCEAQVNGLTCIVSCGVSRESDISGDTVFIKADYKHLGEWVEAIVVNNRKRDINNDKMLRFDLKKTVLEMCEYYVSLTNANSNKREYAEELVCRC